MTEDTSPNLRKFLESDDPAMVRMGISLAKGVGVEITVKDLEHFLKSSDIETIKTGIMLADEAGVGDEAMEMLCESLANDNEEVCQATAEALGEIGDVRAVEPLIKALNVIDEINFIRQYREWNPDWEDIEVFTAVVEALEKLGDVRAVGPLARALESENLWMKSGNDTLYHGFFTIPIVEAMIGIGIDTITENERSKAGGHLRLMLEIGSGEEPIPFPGDHFYDERIAELICVVGPAYCSHWRIASCSGFMPACGKQTRPFVSY